MDASALLQPAALAGTRACSLTPRVTARPQPMNWSIEADILLTSLYKKSERFDIDHFKKVNASGAPRVSKDSYDLVFLQGRLEELLGPFIPETDLGVNTESGGSAPKYLQRIWVDLEDMDGRNASLLCIKCNITPPASYRNVKTEQIRCGHCGNMDSCYLVKAGDVTSSCHTITKALDLQREETIQYPAKPRIQCLYSGGEVKKSNNGISAGFKVAAWDLDTPSKRTAIDIPRDWNVVLDMSLKKEYRKNPKQFDIDGWKSTVHQLFHGAPNLCINPDSYDLVFLHRRLDSLIGPCVCRWNEVDRQSLSPDDEPSFFHREWRAFKDDGRGHRLFCDRCKVSPPIICRNQRRLDEYRCGACGNPNVSREPNDVAYHEHLKSVIESLGCVLGKRKRAGLPEVPREMVNTEVRKRMCLFQRHRTDQPIHNYESSKQDQQGDGRVKEASVEVDEKEIVQVKMEAKDS